MSDLEFSFSADVWTYVAKATWHFVTLPKDNASEIKFMQGKQVGFGSVRVRVKIGDTEWKTSIFPDNKLNSYVLPIKASVRNAESISENDTVTVHLFVDAGI